MAGWLRRRTSVATLTVGARRFTVIASGAKQSPARSAPPLVGDCFAPLAMTADRPGPKRQDQNTSMWRHKFLPLPPGEGKEFPARGAPLDDVDIDVHAAMATRGICGDAAAVAIRKSRQEGTRAPQVIEIWVKSCDQRFVAPLVAMTSNARRTRSCRRLRHALLFRSRRTDHAEHRCGIDHVAERVRHRRQRRVVLVVVERRVAVAMKNTL